MPHFMMIHLYYIQFLQCIFAEQRLALQYFSGIGQIISLLCCTYLHIQPSQFIFFNSWVTVSFCQESTQSTKLNKSLLAATTCLQNNSFQESTFHLLAETTAITECSCPLIRAYSSNQNCLIDCRGSAIPLVSTNILRTAVLAIIYSTAAIRSFLYFISFLLSTATDAAVGQLQKTAERYTCLINYQWLLDPHLSLSEFILNDSVTLIMWIGQKFPNEGCFACSEESSQDEYLSL